MLALGDEVPGKRPPLAITLEQARCLDALARHGTYERAAQSLRKAHTAIVYSIRSLEKQTGLRVVERNRYRTALTPAGERLLERCRNLLGAERELIALATDLRDGWEPRVTIVADVAVPLDPLLAILAELSGHHVPTRFDLVVVRGAAVEDEMHDRDAAIVLAVDPPKRVQLHSLRLPAVRMMLVGTGHVALDPRAPLVALLDDRSADSEGALLRVCDHERAKSAILAGLGVGWLPRHLVERELSSGVVRRARARDETLRLLRPRLFHRPRAELGRAARALVDRFAALEGETGAQAVRADESGASLSNDSREPTSSLKYLPSSNDPITER